MRALFYDTWGFVALANTTDPAHSACCEADEAAERLGFVAVTSDYVLDETLTLLHVSAGPKVALAFADLTLERVAGEDLLLLDVTPGRRGRALETFRKLAPDTPRLSFTDCTSFALMEELGIEVAFSVDRHFHRAGDGIRPMFCATPEGLTWTLPE